MTARGPLSIREGNQGWKKKFFTLQSAEKLLFYGENAKTKPHTCIDIQTAHLARDSESEKVLVIQTDNEIYRLKAPDREKCEMWLSRLRQCQNGTATDDWEASEDFDDHQAIFDEIVHAAQNIDVKDCGDWVLVHNAYSPKVHKNDFETLRILGSGSYGTVVLAKKKDNGKLYAIKMLNKRAVIDKTAGLKQVFTERSVLRRSDSPFIAKAHFTFQSTDKLYFVMDYFEGGDLEKYIESQRGKLHEAQACFFAAEVLVALEFVHSMNVLYRDLKPHNILLDKEGHCCLADFGLSKDFELDNKDVQDRRACSMVGSPYYISPELLLDRNYGPAVDYWSFGVLLYRMLIGKMPFDAQTLHALFENIMTKDVSFPLNSDITPEAKDLILKLLTKNEKERLCSSVRTHPWFRGVIWEDVVMRRGTPPGWMSPAPNATAWPTDTSALNSVNRYTPLDAAQQQKFVGFSCDTPLAETLRPGQTLQATVNAEQLPDSQISL